ncbi:MAG: Rpn family recombination-promoting nuclease/putative transposase [Bacteroidales bacterium]|jgi:predicted transposase/invertase (TIGR01784 family)|nr:Rpn family recombination-promoting nuclease/putative transposase [Bacteroidales bacterium]
MARYLDPKHDIPFKRVFGEHPELLRSFLNALMPFPEGQHIKTLEYLSPEQMREMPLGKNSIVDVKCVDSAGRHFIVEMQMCWSRMFQNRMLFNASKAYVRQLSKSQNYRLLQPVYTLAIVDDIYTSGKDNFLHHYRTVNRENTDEVIEGLEFVVVELPKFRAETVTDRRMLVLWLRFLKEVGSEETLSPELLEEEYIREAISICEEGAFTDKERKAYEDMWDSIWIERGLLEEAKENAEALEKTTRILKAKDKAIEEKNKAIEEKDKTLEEKNKAIEEKDKTLEEKDKTLEEKDKTLEEKDKALEEKDKALEEKDKALVQALAELAALKKQDSENRES